MTQSINVKIFSFIFPSMKTISVPWTFGLVRKGSVVFVNVAEKKLEEGKNTQLPV